MLEQLYAFQPLWNELKRFYQMNSPMTPEIVPFDITLQKSIRCYHVCTEDVNGSVYLMNTIYWKSE